MSERATWHSAAHLLHRPALNADRPPALDPLPRRVAALFAAATFPWAVAGGWAIDLFLNAVTRTHDDIEVAIWRRDHVAARDLLERAGYHLTLQRGGASEPWPHGERLALPIHELHASSPHPDAVALEVLLNEVEGEEFCFRRDPSIRRRLDAAMLSTPSGVPVLAPEIVLLYKSSGSRRPKDDDDFRSCAPALSAEQREWLIDALLRSRPDHPWLTILRGVLSRA